MCSAIGQSITVFQPYCRQTDRQMALIVLTDESGDRVDNDTQSSGHRSRRRPLQALCPGREAVFAIPSPRPLDSAGDGHEHWTPSIAGRKPLSPSNCKPTAFIGVTTLTPADLGLMNAPGWAARPAASSSCCRAWKPTSSGVKSGSTPWKRCAATFPTSARAWR